MSAQHATIIRIYRRLLPLQRRIARLHNTIINNEVEKNVDKGAEANRAGRRSEQLKLTQLGFWQVRSSSDMSVPRHLLPTRRPPAKSSAGSTVSPPFPLSGQNARTLFHTTSNFSSLTNQLRRPLQALPRSPPHALQQHPCLPESLRDETAEDVIGICQNDT